MSETFDEENMWTTITYGCYWCSNGVVSPLSFYDKSLVSTATTLQATWQYPDLWLHSHLACRRAPSWFWTVVNPKTTRAIFCLVGKAMSKWKVGGFHERFFGVFRCFKIYFCQKSCSTERFQDQIPAYLRPRNVTSRTEKNIKHATCSCKPLKEAESSAVFRGPCVWFRSYRRPDDSNSPTMDSAPKRGNEPSYTKLPGSGIHFEGARCSGSTFQTTRADRLIHKQTSPVVV